MTAFRIQQAQDIALDGDKAYARRMPKETYRKLDIAHDYLVVAAELYFQERYFPALALASIAEEIFEAVMRSRNMPGPPNAIGMRFVPRRYQPIAEEQIAIARVVNPRLRKLKDVHVRALLNRAKNSSKHATSKDGRAFDLTIELDPELEAWAMLGRAVENLVRLHYIPEGTVEKFFLQYLKGRKTWHQEGSSEGPHARHYTIPVHKSPDEE